MNPTELVKHLEAQAKELEYLAKECDDAQDYEQAKKCRDSAKETRILANKIRDNDRSIMSKLQQLSQLIDGCNNHCYSAEVCKSLIGLINKFMLQKIEPYSTHLRECGVIYPRK